MYFSALESPKNGNKTHKQIFHVNNGNHSKKPKADGNGFPTFVTGIVLKRLIDPSPSISFKNPTRFDNFQPTEF